MKFTGHFLYFTGYLLKPNAYFLLFVRYILADFIGMYNTLPTVESILSIYNMPVAELEKLPMNDPQIVALVWWYDEYLPKMLDWCWDDDVRYQKLFTDTFTMEGRSEDVDPDHPVDDFVDRIYVTTKAEMFALVMLENCRDKWLEIGKFWRKNGPKVKIPTAGVESLPFRAKYSEAKNGSKRFGGWNEEGLKRNDEIEKLLIEFRKSETVTSGAYPEFIKKLLNKASPKKAEKARIKKKKRATIEQLAEEEVSEEEDMADYLSE